MQMLLLRGAAYSMLAVLKSQSFRQAFIFSGTGLYWAGHLRQFAANCEQHL